MHIGIHCFDPLHGAVIHLSVLRLYCFLPACASEQGNVIGLMSVYMSSKKIVIERTRDLIYLKFVAKDFFPKIISSSAGEKGGDSV